MSQERLPSVGQSPSAGSGGRPTVVHETDLQERRSELRDCVHEALNAQDLTPLQPLLEQQHPADLAEVLGPLDDTDRQQVLGLLSEALTAQVVAELDPSAVREVADGFAEEHFADLVEQMEPDDAADVLGDLPDEQSAKVLEHMELDEAAEVRALLSHAEDTAGGIMTSRLVACSETDTVGEAVARLRSWSEEEEIHYLYVVDDRRLLLGTVPLKRLVVATPETPLGLITIRDPITVRADTDQEEIARMFSEYSLVALPVVDAADRLVGRVTVDDVVAVIQEEATEDMYEMAAIIADDLEARSIMGVMKRRLPWLLVCLVGTLLSGGVIHLFSGPLEKIWLALVAFVPAIMAMGGNTGIQTSTVTVRGLATGQFQTERVGWAVLRELRIAVGMGKLLGVLVFAAAYVWTGDLLVSACVGLAMVAAVVLSAGLGAVIPLLFRALGIDPAVASGPLITTLNDALSLVLYFSIAIALLQRWG